MLRVAWRAHLCHLLRHSSLDRGLVVAHFRGEAEQATALVHAALVEPFNRAVGVTDPQHFVDLSGDGVSTGPTGALWSV